MLFDFDRHDDAGLDGRSVDRTCCAIVWALDELPHTLDKVYEQVLGAVKYLISESNPSLVIRPTIQSSIQDDLDQ